MAKTLLDKVWDAHTVRELPTGQTQLFIGLHLIHEVTSPQAFAMLREPKLDGALPERTFAHASTTSSRPTRRRRPLADALAEEMMRRARAQLRASSASRSSTRRAASRASCT